MIEKRRCVAMALVWLAAVVLTAVPAAALAEVTLDTSVTKVETTIDAAGRVKRQLLPAEDVLPGEELRYAITFTNQSGTVVDRGRIIITNPIPQGTRYVPGSAGGASSRVEYSLDGETFQASEPAPAANAEAVDALRWSYDADLAPGQSAEVHFHVRMQ
jgi:uncharacterized repeat protein (TIGR01451 family)